MFKKHLSKITENEMFSGTVFVSMGLLLAGVFSYILQFFLARLLNLEDYGVFNALLSFSNIFGVFAVVFATSAIKLISELKVKNSFDVLTQLFWKLSAFTLVINLVILLISVSFKKSFALLLNISDYNLLIPFSLYLGTLLFLAIPTAYLQGLLRFKAFAFFAISSSILRLLFPMIFIFLGFKVGGIYFGITLSSIFAFLISLVLLRKNFQNFISSDLTEHFKKLLFFSVPVLLINIGMTTLNNMDVVLVKKFFSDFDTGVYSLVVTVGKIMLFGIGTISVVMFPQISEMYIKGQNYLKKFIFFLALQIFAVFGGLFVFSLFPKFVVSLFGYQHFYQAVPFVPAFSVFMALYVLVNFMILFLLAINKTGSYIFLIPATLVQSGLIYLKHTSLNSVIYINIGVMSVLLFAIIIYTVANVALNNSTRV